MLLLWQLGIVDSLKLFQFCINCGGQYGGLIIAGAAGNMSDMGPSVLLAAIHELGTSYQYLRAAQGAARIATVASFRAMSGRATLTDPAKSGGSAGFIISTKASLTPSEQVILILTVTGSIILIRYELRRLKISLE